jgi:2,3-bisphosphoglycerate-independent phosphoglycerate mutase
MASKSVSPLVLVILDGWGYREDTDGNAIAAAKTPIMDKENLF